jgi:hypothetical protein
LAMPAAPLAGAALAALLGVCVAAVLLRRRRRQQQQQHSARRERELLAGASTRKTAAGAGAGKGRPAACVSAQGGAGGQYATLHSPGSGAYKSGASYSHRSDGHSAGSGSNHLNSAGSGGGSDKARMSSLLQEYGCAAADVVNPLAAISDGGWVAAASAAAQMPCGPQQAPLRSHLRPYGPGGAGRPVGGNHFLNGQGGPPGLRAAAAGGASTAALPSAGGSSGLAFGGAAAAGAAGAANRGLFDSFASPATRRGQHGRSKQQVPQQSAAGSAGGNAGLPIGASGGAAFPLGSGAVAGAATAAAPGQRSLWQALADPSGRRANGGCNRRQFPQQQAVGRGGLGGAFGPCAGGGGGEEEELCGDPAAAAFGACGDAAQGHYACTAASGGSPGIGGLRRGPGKARVSSVLAAGGNIYNPLLQGDGRGPGGGGRRIAMPPAASRGIVVALPATAQAKGGRVGPLSLAGLCTGGEDYIGAESALSDGKAVAAPGSAPHRRSLHARSGSPITAGCAGYKSALAPSAAHDTAAAPGAAAAAADAEALAFAARRGAAPARAVQSRQAFAGGGVAVVGAVDRAALAASCDDEAGEGLRPEGCVSVEGDGEGSLQQHEACTPSGVGAGGAGLAASRRAAAHAASAVGASRYSGGYTNAGAAGGAHNTASAAPHGPAGRGPAGLLGALSPGGASKRASRMPRGRSGGGGSSVDGPAGDRDSDAASTSTRGTGLGSVSDAAGSVAVRVGRGSRGHADSDSSPAHRSQLHGYSRQSARRLVIAAKPERAARGAAVAAPTEAAAALDTALAKHKLAGRGT